MTEVDRNAAALTFEHDADDGVACGGGPCTAVAIVNESGTLPACANSATFATGGGAEAVPVEGYRDK